jgi:hypothetical protein
MIDEESPSPPITTERVTIAAEIAGFTIAPERLRDATAALSELLTLQMTFDRLALSDIDPNIDDVAWPER